MTNASFRGGNYIEGQNDVGICFNLEVIDGSAYSVEHISLGDGKGAGGFVKRLVIHDEEKNDGTNMKEKDTTARNAVVKEVMDKQVPTQGTQVSNKKDNHELLLSQEDEGPVLRKIEQKRAKRKAKKLEKLKATRLVKKLEKKRKRELEKKGQEVSHNESAAEVVPKTQTSQMKQQQQQQPKSEEPQPKKLKTQTTRDNSNGKSIPLATESQITTLQTNWCVATGGVYLHPNICASLHTSQFHTPMPIQASTLAASILGKRDIVGSAPTGSGKTLSYVLPILQWIYTEREERTEIIQQYPLIALILCPTRELAMQVSNEFSKLVQGDHSNGLGVVRGEPKIQCGTIVGGLAEQKQKRVLDVKRPPVLVGTPGRLWELVGFFNLAVLCVL